MEMPKPTEQHAKLNKLAGNFTADETLYPSPWDSTGGKAKGTANARMDLGGFWLVMDYQQQRDGQVTYRGHGVFGYDPKRQQYSMFWVDSMTPATETIWGHWEGDALMFQHQDPQRGWSRYSYRFNSDGSYTMKIENSQDGKAWKPFVEGRYTK